MPLSDNADDSSQPSMTKNNLDPSSAPKVANGHMSQHEEVGTTASGALGEARGVAQGILRKLSRDRPAIVMPEVPRIVVSPAVYKKDDILPADLEHRSLDERPATWRDLAEFAAQHGRTSADIVYDFALLTNNAYLNRINAKARHITPFDFELLLRLYMESPRSCEWARVNVKRVYYELYGPILKDFPPEHSDDAHLMLGRRYCFLLGRAKTRHYGWLGEAEQITRGMSNILSKVMESNNPRGTLERIALKCWSLRGIDAEQEVPLPNLQVLKASIGRPGRKISTKAAGPTPRRTLYAGGAFS